MTYFYYITLLSELLIYNVAKQWYKMDLANITAAFHPLFLQLAEDKDTRDFLSHCREKSDQLFSQLMHLCFKFFLTFFMATTSANGFV